jgi:hypothetical protein
MPPYKQTTSLSEMRIEYNLVVEQRNTEPEAPDRKPYLTKHYAKKNEERALAGLADWDENKANILASGATYIVNWTAHVESRIVTETPWERLET